MDKSKGKKLKLIYLAKISTREGSGVNKKISAQIRSWRKLGLNVYPLFVAKESHVPSELVDINPHIIVQSSVIKFFVKDSELETVVERFEPDLIYFRMGSLPFVSIFRIFSFPVVLEINTRVFEELKVSYSGIKYFILKMYFKLILKRAAGYIGVTKECLLGLQSKRSLQVGNSIDFDRELFQISCSNKSDNICIFVGSPGCPWHGVDKILEIALANPDFIFRIVGYGYDDVAKCENIKIPSNLEFLGYVTGNEYVNVLRSASVAFGSLAMERNMMSYSSSLKNRDYLQYGLPIIIQGTDSELSELSCVYELPMNFSPADVRGLLLEIKSSRQESGFFDAGSVEKAISSEWLEKKRVEFLRIFQS
jgi:hypothetical protein